MAFPRSGKLPLTEMNPRLVPVAGL